MTNLYFEWASLIIVGRQQRNKDGRPDREYLASYIARPESSHQAPGLGPAIVLRSSIGGPLRRLSPSLRAPSSSIDMPPSASWAWKGLVNRGAGRLHGLGELQCRLAGRRMSFWLKLHAKGVPQGNQGPRPGVKGPGGCLASLERSIPPVTTPGSCQQASSHVMKLLPIVSFLQVRLLRPGTEAISNGADA